MAKKSIKRQNNHAGSLSNLVPAEGLITVAFVFNGERHVERHRLNEFEIRQMKELCKEQGHLASQQVVWRGAIKCAEVVARNALYEAGQKYCEAIGKGLESSVEEEATAGGASNSEPNVFSETGQGEAAAAQALQLTAEADVIQIKENSDGN